MTQQATQADDRLVTVKQARQAAKDAYGVPDADRLITDREVAHLLGCSRSWPWKLAREGKMPAPVRLTSRCTRWSLCSVQAYMADPAAWVAPGEGV